MSEVDVADSRRSWRVLGFVLGSVAVGVGLATPALGSQVLPVRVLGGLGWLALVVVGALVILLTAVLVSSPDRRDAPTDRREHPVLTRVVAGGFVLATVGAGTSGSLLVLPLIALATVSVGLSLFPDAVHGWRWCRRAAGWCLAALVVLFVAADVAVRTAVPEGLAAAAVGILTMLATAAAALVLGIAALVGWVADRRRSAPRPAQ